MRHPIASLLVLLLLLLPQMAAAQDASVSAADTDEELAGRVEGDVRVGSADGDLLVGMHFTALLAWDDLRAQLQLPIRLVIEDNGAPNEGVFRAEDWDDVEDFVRLLRFARWSEPGDTLYARVGELSGLRFGHGTVVDRYLNTTSIDRYQPGLHAVINTPEAGGELFLDNVVRPELMGARAFIRPLTLAEGFGRALRSWTLGLSWAGDINAPRQALFDEDGAPRVDEDERVFSRGSVHALTLDSDIEAFRNDWLSLTPYVDGTLMLSEQTGGAFHLGLLSRFALSERSSLTLKGELQHLGAHAMSQYFDTLYELQRVTWPGVGAEATSKLTALEAQDDARTGGLAQLGLDIEGVFQFGATYRDAQGPDNSNLILQAALPALERVQFGALFASSGVSAERLFDPDAFLLQGLLRVSLIEDLDLTATYHRNWRLDTDPGSATFGAYQARDEWTLGAGASFEF